MFLGILLTSNVHYLDPGSGSYIFQLLIAALVGVGFVIKLYWGKIRVFLTRVFSKKDKDQGSRS